MNTNTQITLLEQLGHQKAKVAFKKISIPLLLSCSLMLSLYIPFVHLKSNYLTRILQLLSIAISLSSGISALIISSNLEDENKELQAQVALLKERKKHDYAAAQIQYLNPQNFQQLQLPNQPKYIAPEIEDNDLDNCPVNQLAFVPIEKVKSSPVDEYLAYPCTLIYGGQGAGKTSFAAALIEKLIISGWRVIIIDPHTGLGDWSGLEVIGGGRRYEDIPEKLSEIMELLSERYVQILDRGLENCHFEKIAIYIDEITNLVANIEDKNSQTIIGDFFKSSMTEFRKAYLKVIYTGHDRTMAAIPGIKGLSKLRDDSLLEFNLLSTRNESGESVPSFSGRLKRPGQFDTVGWESIDFDPSDFRRSKNMSHLFKSTPPVITDNDIYSMADNRLNDKDLDTCTHENVKKNGHTSAGLQRYQCNDCGKTGVNL